MYGPGVSFHTNARGFRGTAEVPDLIPVRKRRIVCSGDSFALGFGVDDASTWCQKLSTIDPSLETVNMGQGGYGFDQIFLWYQRDAADFEHHVHLFTFITDDLNRMQRTEFFGYGKPFLSLAGDQLIVENTPVPRLPYLFPWLTRNLGQLSKLRTVRVIKMAKNAWFGGANANAPRRQDVLDRESAQVVEHLLKELKQLNDKRSSVPVVVHLPAIEDYNSKVSQGWRDVISAHAAAAGISYVDLSVELRALSKREAISLFLREDEVTYADAAGHYNVQGNEFIAQALYARLTEIPDVARAIR
jgi:hypothetical protein